MLPSVLRAASSFTVASPSNAAYASQKRSEMNVTRLLCRRFGQNGRAATRPLTSTLQRVRPPPRLTRPSGRRRRFGSESIPIAFVDSRDGQTTTCEAEVGKTVLEAALDHDVDIEAACGGELACSTCHVILEQALYDKLEPPDEEEEDMLDLAWGLEDTSRLCCQIKVSPELKDATFVIPEDPDI
jgi:ferredoxin